MAVPFGGRVGRTKLRVWSGEHNWFCLTALWHLCWINEQKIHLPPQTLTIPPGSFFLWGGGSFNLGHSEWSSNKHVNLSHQTSRQSVHLYYELPRGCIFLVLVVKHSLWKDGRNLTPICPALLQLTLWGESSLLLHVGDSFSEPFLTVWTGSAGHL